MKLLKKIFLLFFFLAQAGTLKTQIYQPMAVDSTLWLNYGMFFYETGPGTSNRIGDTVSFYINGDTIANNKNWKKFSFWSDNIFPVTFHGLIRDDSVNRKVFIKMLPPFTLDTTELLLFDFNLQVGDTFALEGWHLDTLYNPYCCNPLSLGSEWFSDNYVFNRNTHIFTVTNVDSVQLLDGIWRKRIQTTWFDWIEGLGSTYFCPLFRFAKILDRFNIYIGCKLKINSNGSSTPIFSQKCSVPNEMPCYPYWLTDVPLCNNILNFEEKLNPNAEIQVYPNPNDGSFRVTHGYGFNELQVYDVQGNSMFYQKINGTETSVKLKLSAGTYTLRLSGRLGEKFHKIIIL